MSPKNRPQKLKSITFEKLKNLENLTISFEGEPITGIFGVNGAGKSTVLHVLACLYKPLQDSDREDYKFSRFFVPTTLDLWSGSKFSICYEQKNNKSEVCLDKLYRKNKDRWNPRYNSRPEREVYFIGLDTCVPEMELESRRFRIQLSKKEFSDSKLAQEIIKSLSTIMNRTYEEISDYWDQRKSYKGLKYKDIRYSSLYMGAGEQRLIKYLEKVYTAPEYSLILIDELDLTLHTEALLRLMKILHSVCKKRNIQIVFTSHREELLNCDYINTRHLISGCNGKTSICLESTTPECVRRLTGNCTKPFEIFVEDKLAEVLVRGVLKQHNVEPYFKISKFGAATNAYSVGAGLILMNETLKDKTLIVLDGDVDTGIEDKREKLKKNLVGSDHSFSQKRNDILSCIKQFCLPADTPPEVYIVQELKKLKDSEDSLLLRCIQDVETEFDSHDLLKSPIEKSGMLEDEALSEIVKMMRKTPGWTHYVSEIDQWVREKSAQCLGVNSSEHHSS